MSGRNQKPRVLDLFAGCGGLSFGFERAGYEVTLGLDNWSDALETFSHNHRGAKTKVTDLANEKPEVVAKEFGYGPGSFDVVIGGPPCQGFSIAGKRIIQDPRNGLYKSFVDYVRFFKPKAFVMENVPNLVSMAEGKVKDKIISDFTKTGYKVSYKVLLASDYGVPQNRRRVFFVGIRGDENFIFPPQTFGILKPAITSSDAISDLPEGSLIDGSRYPGEPLTEYQRIIRKGSKGVYNHEVTIHTEQTVKIIGMVPDGGNYKSLPKHLWNTRRVNIAWTRLNSKKPSFTIDTGHNHHFHYKYNRVPTARESARLQSFPDIFIFFGKKMSQLKQVGNAVPPLLGEAVAKQLLNYLYE